MNLCHNTGHGLTHIIMKGISAVYNMPGWVTSNTFTPGYKVQDGAHAMYSCQDGTRAMYSHQNRAQAMYLCQDGHMQCTYARMGYRQCPHARMGHMQCTYARMGHNVLTPGSFSPCWARPAAPSHPCSSVPRSPAASPSPAQQYPGYTRTFWCISCQGLHRIPWVHKCFLMH